MAYNEEYGNSSSSSSSGGQQQQKNQNQSRPPPYKREQDIQNDFQLFRAAVPIKRANLPYREEVWAYYELAGGEDGDNNDMDPVVFLPGTTTGAESFFYQLDALSCKGYRCIACQYPAYYTVEEWVEGFERFLDVIKAKKVHIFGNSLGGFLAQAYAVQYPRRCASLVLCNSFSSTVNFADAAGGMVSLVHITPTVALRKFLLDAFPTFNDPKLQEAANWVARRLDEGESLDGYDLAGRITLTYTLATIGHLMLDPARILIIDVNDECVTTSTVQNDLTQRYPDAKQAVLKQGGDFPFLSSWGEITLFIEVHLRKCGLYPLKEQVEEQQAELGGGVNEFQQQYEANQEAWKQRAIIEAKMWEEEAENQRILKEQQAKLKNQYQYGGSSGSSSNIDILTGQQGSAQQQQYGQQVQPQQQNHPYGGSNISNPLLNNANPLTNTNMNSNVNPLTGGVNQNQNQYQSSININNKSNSNVSSLMSGMMGCAGPGAATATGSGIGNGFQNNPTQLQQGGGGGMFGDGPGASDSSTSNKLKAGSANPFADDDLFGEDSDPFASPKPKPLNANTNPVPVPTNVNLNTNALLQQTHQSQWQVQLGNGNLNSYSNVGGAAESIGNVQQSQQQQQQFQPQQQSMQNQQPQSSDFGQPTQQNTLGNPMQNTGIETNNQLGNQQNAPAQQQTHSQVQQPIQQKQDPQQTQQPEQQQQQVQQSQSQQPPPPPPPPAVQADTGDEDKPAGTTTKKKQWTNPFEDDDDFM